MSSSKALASRPFFRQEEQTRKVATMWRFVFIGFLIAHGVIHAAIWALPKPAGQQAPFDPAHSWVLGESSRRCLRSPRRSY